MIPMSSDTVSNKSLCRIDPEALSTKLKSSENESQLACNKNYANNGHDFTSTEDCNVMTELTEKQSVAEYQHIAIENLKSSLSLKSEHSVRDDQLCGLSLDKSVLNSFKCPTDVNVGIELQRSVFQLENHPIDHQQNHEPNSELPELPTFQNIEKSIKSNLMHEIMCSGEPGNLKNLSRSMTPSQQQLLAASQLLYAHLFRSNMLRAEQFTDQPALHVMNYNTELPNSQTRPVSRNDNGANENDTSFASRETSKNENRQIPTQWTNIPLQQDCESESKPTHQQEDSKDYEEESVTDDLHNSKTCQQSEKISFNNTNSKFLSVLQEQQTCIEKAKINLNKYRVLESQLMSNVSHSDIKTLSTELDTVSKFIMQSRNFSEAHLNDINNGIQRLHQQCVTAQMYYGRTLQRLSPTNHVLRNRAQMHAIIKASKALAIESEILKSSVKPIKEENLNEEADFKDDMERGSESIRKYEKTEYPTRSLRDIEDFILEYASKVGNSCDPNDSDEISLPSPTQPGSPVCFWHPQNQVHKKDCSGNDYALTAAEIILECAALTNRSNAKDTASSIAALAADMAFKDESKKFSYKVDKESTVITDSVDKNSTPLNLTPNISTPLSLNGCEKVRIPNSQYSTFSSTSNINIPHLSTQLRNRRKPNFARRIESTTKDNNEVKSTVVGTNSSVTTPSNFSSPNNSYATFSVPTSSPTCNMKTTPSFSSFPTSASKTSSGSTEDDSAASTSPSMTTASTIAALQERALTDMFKARFNALTAAAVAINASASSTSSTADVPFDLSIGAKFKQM